MKHLLFCCLSLLILFSACKKEQDVIGLELQEDDALLGNTFCDTVSITAFSLRQDSIVTKNLANCTFGCINDPVFGKTTASFYTQLDLSGSNINFGTSPTLDSVVFTLPYTGYYGDTNTALTVRIYELTEALTSDETYYQFTTKAHAASNLTYEGSHTLTPKPTTGIYLDSTLSDPQIRIRLTNTFGTNRILNNTSLTDNNAFQNDLKGLFITVDNVSGNGCLIYSNLLSSLAGLTIYYKNANNENQQKYTFSISASNCIFFTNYNHNNYAGACQDLKNQINNGQTELGKSTLYLQGTAGIMARIKFPNLSNSFAKNVIVNMAELVITDLSEEGETLTPPVELGLQLVRTDNQLGYLPDDKIYTSASYFGGAYDSDKKEYRFRVTKYVQQRILGGIEDNGINIVASGAGIRANRLMFCGPQPDEILKEKRLRLEIYYTTY